MVPVNWTHVQDARMNVEDICAGYSKGGTSGALHSQSLVKKKHLCKHSQLFMVGAEHFKDKVRRQKGLNDFIVTA